MAESTELSHEIDVNLKYNHLIVDDLPDQASDWEECSLLERIAFSLDWDQAMGGRLRLLQEHYAAGTMTPDQRASYEDLLRKLRGLLPTIKRLDLYVPPILQTV